MYKIQDGNVYNVQVPTYYVESDDELDLIPASAPAGTIAEINESGNFHVKMKMEDGSWNEL